MRLKVRNQLCEIIATIYDGISYAIESGYNAAETVLADCTEAAEAVRQILRGQQLTEARAALYARLSDEVAAAIAGISENAQPEGVLEILETLHGELAAESEIKLEIAFFPYKASMWDCMESIWAAAKDDPDCNVTVVPIRYFDRAPGGAILKTHCERDLFPDYVPVTRFEDYNLAEEAPDIAYIHNPYDNNNYVTSVDPEYYSFKLKKHVGLLVYVPYYVSGWKPSDSMVSIACASAADIIVLSAERDAEMFREMNPAKDYAVLGSPKLDRILKFERNKPEMPPEWRDKLSGKKVFLLNTSVSTLLRHGESFYDKMKRMFDMFEGSENAAVLWRPHPLSDATMTSMRPDLLEGYHALEKRVKDGSFGVLDETADVTRAIALSDAYVGVGATSLLYMYAVTGKPLYLLDFDIARGLTETEHSDLLRRYVNTGAIIPETEGTSLLAVRVEANEICRINAQTGSVVPAAAIPGVDPSAMYAYTFLVDCGDKYILPPACSDKFIELDRDFKLIKTVEIPERAKADAVFGYYAKHGDFVYFIPSWSTAIARYCISTGKYEYFYEWYKDFEQFAEDDDPAFLSPYSCIVGNRLYLPCYKGNVVTEINLDTMAVKARRVGPDGYRYYSITHDGRYFWLTRYRKSGIEDEQWRDSIVRWDSKTDRIMEISAFPEGFECGIRGAMYFLRIMYCGGHLLAFPYGGNMILKIDPKSCAVTEFGAETVKTKENTDELLIEQNNVAFGYMELFGENTLVATMPRERALLTVNVQSGEANKVKMRFDENYKGADSADPRMFRPPDYSRTQKGIYYERLLFPPEEFIVGVATGEITALGAVQADFYLDRTENADGTCGEKIHEYAVSKFIGARENGAEE